MTMNMINTLNFILSATAATIRAGVMIANIIWNTMKVVCGIVIAYWFEGTSCSTVLQACPIEGSYESISSCIRSKGQTVSP